MSTSDDKAKIEGARKQTQVQDSQGKTHQKPLPPPLRTIKKGAWTNPETQIQRDRVLRK